MFSELNREGTLAGAPDTRGWFERYDDGIMKRVNGGFTWQQL